MPRTSRKAQALQDIDTEVEGIAYAYVWHPYQQIIMKRILRTCLFCKRLLSPTDTNSLAIVQDGIMSISLRLIFKTILTAFLNHFRMYRASFWQVVGLLALSVILLTVISSSFEIVV
ncbi:hypothetical protein L211DRAFT_637608 [Terfezia boudieri ATCC MYA-4762]|uniref:Uncharacterized protein n=1 Tax=Terfezia boudieri ATCC MYA-4762 TaxID=1051890 RepID=A0A3N4LN07_9PEZI|nr:hypothetical protein L211DRAFT_637608 [Terfezia boudieri ATCC MYA-4762]